MIAVFKPSLACLILCAPAAFADPPEIVEATAKHSGDSWTISVTLAHPDTGWDHYADGWEVLASDGTSLGVRVLVHPHVNEQPFTRSLGGIRVPEGATTLQIRARCLVDGWNGETHTLTLPN
ncbi:MAG: hypothetical protein LJE68_02370 [Rhodobacter sp.]|nr:hypothetical protein [Rhodobacter sp.]